MYKYLWIIRIMQAHLSLSCWITRKNFKKKKPTLCTSFNVPIIACWRKEAKSSILLQCQVKVLQENQSGLPAWPLQIYSTMRNSHDFSREIANLPRKTTNKPSLSYNSQLSQEWQLTDLMQRIHSPCSCAKHQENIHILRECPE